MERKEIFTSRMPKCRIAKSRKRFMDKRSVTDGGHIVEEL
jgi:hypothetical protein